MPVRWSPSIHCRLQDPAHQCQVGHTFFESETCSHSEFGSNPFLILQSRSSQRNGRGQMTWASTQATSDGRELSSQSFQCSRVSSLLAVHSTSNRRFVVQRVLNRDQAKRMSTAGAKLKDNGQMDIIPRLPLQASVSPSPRLHPGCFHAGIHRRHQTLLSMIHLDVCFCASRQFDVRR